jgi:hypothetical protein
MTDELFRVRDKNWTKIWGENLTLADANRLKEQVVTGGKSRTARIEPMSVQPPGSEVIPPPAAEPAPASPPARTQYEYIVESSDVDLSIQLAGLIKSIPKGHALLVNGVMMPVPTSVKNGDVVRALPQDPAIIAAQAAARAAVAPVAAAARRSVVDVTVKKPAPRAAPPPPDRTVDRGPLTVRLGAPPVAPPVKLPSPLKVATQVDGDPLPDGAISEDDVSDLAIGLGADETAADVRHAEAQRDRERERP